MESEDIDELTFEVKSLDKRFYTLIKKLIIY